SAEVIVRNNFPPQNHRGQDCRYIRSKKVRPHTCHVAYIVSYVIGNGGRVTYIIFRNARFDFSHKISAYIRSFSIYSSPYAGEQCDRLSTKGKPSQDLQGRLHLMPVDIAAYRYHENIVKQ